MCNFTLKNYFSIELSKIIQVENWLKIVILPRKLIELFRKLHIFFWAQTLYKQAIFHARLLTRWLYIITPQINIMLLKLSFKKTCSIYYRGIL